MLQIFRTFAKSFVAKLLFAVLLLSFGVWGIGDLFRQNPGGHNIITVGDKEIGAEQVRTTIDQNIQRMKMSGMTIDRDQARQYGVVDNAVETLIARSLLDQEAARLNLQVGDTQVAQSISDDPSFHDKDGKLDRDRFKGLLAANHMTERQYVELIRGDIPREAIAGVAQNAPAPKTLVNMIFGQKQERRVADFVFLSASSIGDVGQPTEAQLRDFYAQHKGAFTSPEYRSFTALLITAADASSSVTIPTSKLQETYQFRIAQFAHGELRDVKQMLLPDQATALRAKAALDHGQNFTAVAKSLAHQSDDTIDLGFVERPNLPADLGAAAFSAKSGAVTPPLKTELGWTILKIGEIQPAGTRSFNEVKPQLEAELKREQSGDSLYQLSNKIEDALAAGADLSAIAQQFNLKPLTVANVDAEGMLANGQPQTTLTLDAAPILKSAFDTPQGQSSALQQTNDDKFYVVHVDHVAAASLKAFDAAKPAIIQAWANNQRDLRIAEQAKALAATVKPGTSLAVVAAGRKLAVSTSEPLLRTDTEAALPVSLIQQFFVMKIGGVTLAAGRNGNQDGQFVAALKEIRPADNKVDAPVLDALEKRLGTDIGTEMEIEFTDTLRQRYPVKIDNKALDQIL